MSRYLHALLLVALLQLVTWSRAENRHRPRRALVLRDLDDPGPEYKRRQGFVGVKGKKDLPHYVFYPADPYTFYKRAPTGFVGMRGKKFDDMEMITEEYVPKRGSLLGQIDYSTDDDVDTNFDILTTVLQKYLQDNSETETNSEADTAAGSANTIANEESDSRKERSSELAKRAAKMSQFFGMRGKKEGRDNKRPFDLSFRGKFVGVRGKKSAGLEEYEKRKGAGFYGVRGKKNYEDLISEDNPQPQPQRYIDSPL